MIYNHPIGKKKLCSKWCISGIYCQLGDDMPPPPIKGPKNNHWFNYLLHHLALFSNREGVTVVRETPHFVVTGGGDCAIRSGSPWHPLEGAKVRLKKKQILFLMFYRWTRKKWIQVFLNQHTFGQGIILGMCWGVQTSWKEVFGCVGKCWMNYLVNSLKTR